jgi:Insulinase (Peptidase family M16)
VELHRSIPCKTIEFKVTKISQNSIIAPRKQLSTAILFLITAIFIGDSSLIKQRNQILSSLKMSLDSPPFEIPAVDEYAYRLITLDNGIQALLIHDPEADKAAAATDVRVGSMSDPIQFPGLAHFTEHMLFYSSAKYPKEDEYSKFISDHGGKVSFLFIFLTSRLSLQFSP